MNIYSQLNIKTDFLSSDVDTIKMSEYSVGSTATKKKSKRRVINKMSLEQVNVLENWFLEDPTWSTKTISKSFKSILWALLKSNCYNSIKFLLKVAFKTNLEAYFILQKKENN